MSLVNCIEVIGTREQVGAWLVMRDSYQTVDHSVSEGGGVW